MRLALILACLLSSVLFTQARAEIVDIEVLPSQPAANYPVTVRFHYTIDCGFFAENLDGESHAVHVSGEEVVLDVVMANICADPPPSGVFEHDVPLGLLSEGDYQLTINRVSNHTTFPVTPDERVELAQMPLGVGMPLQIPVFGWIGFLVLVGGVGFMASRALRVGTG